MPAIAPTRAPIAAVGPPRWPSITSTLADVHAGADLEVEVPHVPRDGFGTPNGGGWTLERCVKPSPAVSTSAPSNEMSSARMSS